MKMKAKEFKELIDTMLQGGEIISESVQTTGRPGLFYRLLPTVKEGEAW